MNNQCTICLDPLDNGELVTKIKKCGHNFHHECINGYLNSGVREKNQYECPLCRNDFDESDLVDIINKKTNYKPSIPTETLYSFLDDYKEENLEEDGIINCNDFLDELKIVYGKQYSIDENYIINFCND